MKGSVMHREAMMLSSLVAGMLICSASCFPPSVLPRALPRRPISPLSLSHLEAAAEGVDRRGALRFMAVPFFMPRGAWAVSPFNRYTDECEVDACINRDKRVFTRAGKKFTLRQEFDKKGSKSTGSAVWEGDIVMTRYMENDLPRSYWEGKTVLELGAGIGFAGMVAVLLGAGDVALTDGDQKVLELARRNVDENLSQSEASKISYEKLRWELAADKSWKYDGFGGKPVDIILAADLTYYKDNIPPLMRMMRRLCSPNTEIILTHTVRPTDGESMQQFYDKFDVTKIDKGPSFEGHPETFMYRMKAKAGPESAEDEADNNGCKPGYVLKKNINLCVPAAP